MKNNKGTMPLQVAARLPKYYRVLRGLFGDDCLRISSVELAERMSITPSKVRQDFSYLGGIGTKGYGYNVKDLYSAVGAKLGIPNNYGAVLVCRDIRFACFICSDESLRQRGIRLKAIFTDEGDFSPAEINSASPSKPDTASYKRAAEYCASEGAKGEPIAVAILCCEKSEAEAAARALEAAGIIGFWNFTGEALGVSAKTVDVCLSDSLLSLCCEITEGENISNKKGAPKGT